ncbi:MAG: SUMF1/EgtB/PvdO family nonheme iron enzyme [Anaerolineae bacterium]
MALAHAVRAARARQAVPRAHGPCVGHAVPGRRRRRRAGARGPGRGAGAVGRAAVRRPHRGRAGAGGAGRGGDLGRCELLSPAAAGVLRRPPAGRLARARARAPSLAGRRRDAAPGGRDGRAPGRRARAGAAGDRLGRDNRPRRRDGRRCARLHRGRRDHEPGLGRRVRRPARRGRSVGRPAARRSARAPGRTQPRSLGGPAGAHRRRAGARYARRPALAAPHGAGRRLPGPAACRDCGWGLCDRPLRALRGAGRRWWPRYTPHDVRLAAFALGRFPVTNAEWACFMAAGGYEDERWWDTPAAADWRRGIGTTVGIHASVREWVVRYRATPDHLDAIRREGGYSAEVYERWLRRLTMTEAELALHLAEQYPSVRQTAPRHWSNGRFNHPAQPVVAVTWYEARAYCAWLATQTGRPFRLPTDVELEAAGRGSDGLEYPWGGPFDPLRLNCVSSHVMTTTPVGVYPDGDSASGITDLSGNVETWTSTLVGAGDDTPPDGAREWRPDLEVVETPATARRVVRGGSWADNHSRVHPCYGVGFGADFCPDTVGVRVACGVGGVAIEHV